MFGPSLLNFLLRLPCVLALVVVSLNSLLFLLWTCPTRQAGTDVETVTGGTSEVVFDLNDLTTVFDLKLGDELVVVGVLPGVWAHWTGLFSALFEPRLGASGGHDGAAGPGKFGAAQHLFKFLGLV